MNTYIFLGTQQLFKEREINSSWKPRLILYFIIAIFEHCRNEIDLHQSINHRFNNFIRIFGMVKKYSVKDEILSMYDWFRLVYIMCALTSVIEF